MGRQLLTPGRWEGHLLRKTSYMEEDKMVSPRTLYFDIYKDYNGSSLKAFIGCYVLTEASIRDSVICEGYRPIFSNV